MVKINLREYYPYYNDDVFVEVSDELAEEMRQWQRDEHAYKVKKNRNKAFYSLDRPDFNETMLSTQSTDQSSDVTLSKEELFDAFSMLTAKQAKRVYAFYFQGLSQTQIAEAEGVSKMAVCLSIAKAMKQLANKIKK